MHEVAIIGIGNLLQKDDGIGVHVINQMQAEALPTHVRLVDGGTAIFNMLSYFRDYKKIIIIDAVEGGMEPGTIYKIKPEKISSSSMKNSSLHSVGILELIKLVNQMGQFPEVLICGIEPQEIKLGLEMTELIQSKIPEVIKLIKQELNLNTFRKI